MNAMRQGPEAAGYAGDVSPAEAWDMLNQTPSAQLIDVRTRAEWSYVGLPDLSGIGRKPVLAEWQSFPDGARNMQFATEAEQALGASGGDRDAPVLVLCRSGARSRAAAMALTARGYTRAYNIANGFEGDHDEQGQRGHLNGWKADHLPWRQG